MLRVVPLLVLLTHVLALAEDSLPPTCNSRIYCQGDLLRTVQLARIFNDSKTFVDLKLINSEEKTLDNFEKFMQQHQQNPSVEDIKIFVNSHFEEGDELQTWTPPDFKPNPQFLEHINEDSVRNFAQQLVNIWPTLARKVKSEVTDDSEKYSLVPVPNGFIIPGGRFKEYYYWDSYWIINGLLISEMEETAKGMIENFFSLVKTYGYVFNGGRVYYSQRSQPPLLTSMVTSYFSYSNNKTWLAENIAYVNSELMFWLENRAHEIENGKSTYTLALYNAPSTGPRPESYREDINTASVYTNEQNKQKVYTNLKSGAESGWDFSSRWLFDENGEPSTNLSNVATTNRIPVDLNSFLCGSFHQISKLYKVLNDTAASEFWQGKANAWQEAVENILWNEEDGIWYDVDSTSLTPLRSFYPSNFAPLWTGCYDTSNTQVIAERVLNYLKESKAHKYDGGIPTSLHETGQQWDLPNAWPPLQAIVVQGLDRTGDERAKEMARDLARKWISANMKGFSETGEMFEKYDAVQSGKYGGGGEYTVQSGFGWSNGVALEFINQYYRDIDDSDEEDDSD